MGRDLRRIGIYPYRKGMSVYYDKRSKICYLIPNDEVKKFELISNRYVMGIMAVILFYYFVNKNLLFSFILGVTVAVVLEAYFRFSMLKSYNIAKNPDIGEIYDRRKELNTQNPRIIMFKTLAYFFGATGIFIFLIIYPYPIEQQITIAALALYAIYNGYVNLSVYLKKKKEAK